MKREPLYEQIKKYLLEEICKHAGDRQWLLPSENALCTKYSVSRITAKRALNDLEEEGIIRRVRGKGSVVCENLPEYLMESAYASAAKKTPAAPRILTAIVPDLTSKYYLDLMEGITAEADKEGWLVALENSNNLQEKESFLIKKALPLSDGMIISPVNYNKYNQEIVKLSLKNYPMCLVDNNLNRLYLNFVSSDSFNAVYEATQYFIRQGKTRIGYLTLPEKYNMALEERRRGYEQALYDHNIPLRKQYILNASHNSLFDDGKLHEFFNNNPDMDALITALCGLGIFAIKELLAVSNMKLIQNMIVFDEDFPQMNELLRVKVKFIRQNTIEIGRKAAELVIRQYNNPSSNLHETIKIPTQLFTD